jgi:hypothetical protein
MRKISFIAALLLVSCTDFFLGKDPTNTPIEIFDEFWNGVDDCWPEFESKRVNWDSIYNIYRPQINQKTSDYDLKNVLGRLVNILEDGHTTIYPKNQAKIGYYPRYDFNFYGLNWIRQNYLTYYKYNSAIGYGLISQDVGYIYIGTFGNQDEQYSIIDQIIQDFNKVKGIIIDVRSNSGGNKSPRQIIASRFADKQRIYAYERYRVNKQQPTKMSDFVADDIEPSGSVQFKGKVAVLTNRYSFSATEEFVLSMKCFPQIIQIGDYTNGGSGTSPILKELPNGWSYRVSTSLLCDLNRKPIRMGIEPDIIVYTTKEDSLKMKDSIVERAIVEVLK